LTLHPGQGELNRRHPAPLLWDRRVFPVSEGVETGAGVEIRFAQEER
jgi:hypothetical protein